MNRDFSLSASHPAIKQYFKEIGHLEDLDFDSEGSISPAFAGLLKRCSQHFGWDLIEKYRLDGSAGPIIVDGAIIDSFRLRQVTWEAKDSKDNLDVEIRKKFEAGYPNDNIIFQAPREVSIWQQGQEVFRKKLETNQDLANAVKILFSYKPPQYDQWHQASEEFKKKVPELGRSLKALIDKEQSENEPFAASLLEFTALIREAVNPNTTEDAVEEMLVQHILTERLFRKVFNNPDFKERNVIAKAIEKVISKLLSRRFSRSEFLKPLDPFYGAIESTADTISDYAQKQSFLNTVYEKFFQGFSSRVADTHGIVYTPQPIVDYMVHSITHLLEKEFGRSVANANVHVLDPFVGTGNFIVRTLREIPISKLTDKYEQGLHCNEVMLLPYYIASLNIEHEYYERMKEYRPFEGICLVDTFDLERTGTMFSEDNANRVRKQRSSPIFVIMGNPPYNAGQKSENDNNKNRKYPELDLRVKNTYAKDSHARLKKILSDPYVKAFRWATDRIGQEGIVAFVSNNSFVHDTAFDGMRANLARDYDKIYILDLGGNVKKNPKLSGTTHNVFGINPGVSINILIRKAGKSEKLEGREAEIYYTSTPEFMRRSEKYLYLDEKYDVSHTKWKRLKPDQHNRWLTAGHSDEYDRFLPLGSHDAKSAESASGTIFRTYSPGINTARDYTAYNFNKEQLASTIQEFESAYAAELDRYKRKGHGKNVDDFVDKTKLKWSATLKRQLMNSVEMTFSPNKIRRSLFRPFTKQFIYYDEIVIDRPGRFKQFVPDAKAEESNMMICVPGGSARSPFWCLATNVLPNYTLVSIDASRVFPLYVYDEDGNRQNNITDWALQTFRGHYSDKTITKTDIFHYVYGALHHPVYRKNYAFDLKQGFPRIPFHGKFWPIAEIGHDLLSLHIGYESVNEYPLKWAETPGKAENYKVSKMRISKDRTALQYNEYLKASGIPEHVWNYRLGNKSALEWVIDQYRSKRDKRTGLNIDPNISRQSKYVMELIGKVVMVSVNTKQLSDKLSSSQWADASDFLEAEGF